MIAPARATEDSKVMQVPLITCVLLRGEREDPVGTPLDSGETIRLKIIIPADGVFTVTEGSRTLVSGRIEHDKPFTTDPLPFNGTGVREIRITFTDATGGQRILPLALTYR
jgi:hypothetical protein